MRESTCELAPSHNHRANSKAYITINNQECWVDVLDDEGAQQCGDASSNDNVIRVKCDADADNGELKIVVYNELNNEANKASFGIDNVTITRRTVAGK